jgi:hypothetical protein
MVAVLIVVIVVYGKGIVAWMETFRPQPYKAPNIMIVLPTQKIPTPVPTATPFITCIDGIKYRDGIQIATPVRGSIVAGGCF